MEAARSWGVPHSVFTGRVVRSGDPQWTAADTALGVALQVLESVSCSGCGVDRRESMDAESEFEWRAESVRCHGCAARDRAAESYAKSGGSPSGLNWVVKRKGQEVVA